MFFAVELESNDVSKYNTFGEHYEMRTSLTGMEETPISIAMNQDALARELATISDPGKIWALEISPKIATPSQHTFWKGIVIGDFDVG
jgi:hypothetical protein